MSKNIYNINLSILQSHNNLSEKYLNNKFPELVNEIYLNTSFLNDYNPTFSERRYCYINQITDIIKCKVCDKKVPFIKGYGYKKTCNDKNCFVKYMKTEATKQCKQSKLERYGNENYNNIKKLKSYHDNKDWEQKRGEKISKTKNTKTEEEKLLHIMKIKQSKLERYGNENYNNPRKMIKTKMNNISKGMKYKHTFPNILYIIYSIDFDLIKIGITSDFERRIKDIKKEFKTQNIKILNLIEYKDTITILSKESKLHKLFEKFNVRLDSGGGKTEWYSSKIKKYLKLSKLIRE